MIGDSQKDKLADGVRSAFISQPVIVAFLIAFLVVILVAGYMSQSQYNDLQNTINFLLEECIIQEHRSR